MKEDEARKLLNCVLEAGDYHIDKDYTINEAKRRELIEQTPLEKWNAYSAPLVGMQPTVINTANAMRDYLLTQLAERDKEIASMRQSIHCDVD